MMAVKSSYKEMIEHICTHFHTVLGHACRMKIFLDFLLKALISATVANVVSVIA